MTKYAVYIVLVEDTEQADTALAQSVDSMERLKNGLTYGEAAEYIEEIGDVEAALS